MNNKSLCSITLLALGSSLGFAQFYGPLEFTGSSFPVSASVDLNFDDATDTLTVFVTNTTDESVGSFIDEFYILRPLVNGAPAQFSLTDTINDPEWTLAGSLSTQFSNLYSGNTALYFGAEWLGGNSDKGGRISVPEPKNEDTNPRTFLFSFTGPLDFSNWSEDGPPVMFMRWQGIGPNDQSDKGFITFKEGPPFEPAVPEPSSIAALGMLGMGALLFLRRRFVRK